LAWSKERTGREVRTLIRRSVESLTGYVPGEQPTDPTIIKLNTNENPYPPSPAVARVLKEFDPDTLRLYPEPMSKTLRERIAEIHGCGPQNVFVGNGCDEVLALCTRAFVDDDEAIGYFDPSYSLYPVLSAIRDVRTAPVALGEGFSWPFDADSDVPLDRHEVVKYLSECTATLFFLTNPNAPTGLLYHKAHVRRFCEAFRGVVVIDEAYVDFARRHCVDLCMELDNVLVVRTLSKSYSLAGIRIGYALGPENLIDAMFKLKDSYNVDTISQRIALAALSDLDYVGSCTNKILATRERLSGELTKRGIQVFPSDANFVWIKPFNISAVKLSAKLKAAKILVRHFDDELTRDYLRITIGTDEQIDALIEAIDIICGGRKSE
jgi:histidinol-phosphate aminotransferase